jgi:hypothetical protein
MNGNEMKTRMNARLGGGEKHMHKNQNSKYEQNQENE